ncbi:MAG: rRNA pseudouridine synthase [Chlorobi bacterium]|nr:rRNA pseudouridine synthase [Chlorobiota bacterium]
MSQIRINKFLSLAGVASRRKADELIKAGRVKINDRIAVPGDQVEPKKDKVYVDGKEVVYKPALYYILLNKPNDVITTRSDEKGRKTVMDLIPEELRNVVFPVGRLDRNTTGILLLTNDGDLANRLIHPSYNIPKEYIATLDKPVAKRDLIKLVEGITLQGEKEPISVDETRYEDPSKKVIYLRLHSGKNRVIRRLFDHLGYKVKKLNRISFAGLKRQGLKPGEWRYLYKREVRHLHNLTGLKWHPSKGEIPQDAPKPKKKPPLKSRTHQSKRHNRK